jgi:hypothetical protein
MSVPLSTEERVCRHGRSKLVEIGPARPIVEHRDDRFTTRLSPTPGLVGAGGKFEIALVNGNAGHGLLTLGEVVLGPLGESHVPDRHRAKDGRVSKE